MLINDIIRVKTAAHGGLRVTQASVWPAGGDVPPLTDPTKPHVCRSKCGSAEFWSWSAAHCRRSLKTSVMWEVLMVLLLIHIDNLHEKASWCPVTDRRAEASC